MTPETNKGRQDRFRELLTFAAMTRREAAELLGVSLDTVHSWLKPEGNHSASRLPYWALRLLELEITKKREGAVA